MINTSFYSYQELCNIGFKSFGSNVLISRKASFFNAEKIEIGDDVRIDDFCILSGDIKIGSNIHISAYSAIYGGFGVELEDFVTISGRVLIYSQNDDYSGNYYTNPMVPKRLTNVTGGKVTMRKYSIIGAGSIILPNITINTGGCVGAMSLVKTNIPEWEVYAGVPAKYKSRRSNDLLNLKL